MRTIWNGSINFGLVNIPIGLAVAQQRQDIAFRTLHRECGTPIKQKRYCPQHERDVEADELVKGWEFTKGQFVMVEEDDLEAVALERSQSIDLIHFVRVADVDPIFFDRTYYLSPASATAQRRPYVLLLRAMQEAGVGGVGKFVLWGKENLCLIRPLDDSLVLETLFYSEDLRSRDEIDEAVHETELNDAELGMAIQLVESLIGEWDSAEFRNEHRDAMRAMLEAKLAGKEITRPEPIAPTPVVDLMDALRKSVAQAQAQRQPEKRKRAKASAPRKRAAARSS
jgi:DNA end-binding protein Ku